MTDEDENRRASLNALDATLDGDLERTVEALAQMDRQQLALFAEQTRQLSYAADNYRRQHEAIVE